MHTNKTLKRHTNKFFYCRVEVVSSEIMTKESIGAGFERKKNSSVKRKADSDVVESSKKDQVARYSTSESCKASEIQRFSNHDRTSASGDGGEKSKFQVEIKLFLKDSHFNF